MTEFEVYRMIFRLQAEVRELQAFKALLPTKLHNSRLQLATQQIHFPSIPIPPGDRQLLPSTGEELRGFNGESFVLIFTNSFKLFFIYKF
ncbi:hypothetical protein TWF281_009346 [Arthrobotrys megalospora]